MLVVGSVLGPRLERLEWNTPLLGELGRWERLEIAGGFGRNGPRGVVDVPEAQPAIFR